MRGLDIFLAIWVCIDIALDVNQTKTYFVQATEENGTYGKWIASHKSINETYDELSLKLSPSFYVIAMTVWMIRLNNC